MFYVLMAIAVVIILIAARIMGMPNGLGVEHEPEETSPAQPGAPAR
jgi:hypothetical protein